MDSGEWCAITTTSLTSWMQLWLVANLVSKVGGWVVSNSGWIHLPCGLFRWEFSCSSSGT